MEMDAMHPVGCSKFENLLKFVQMRLDKLKFKLEII